MNNPLLKSPSAPHGAYPLDVVKAEHFIPALKEAIEESKKKLEAFKKNSATDFHHVIVEKSDITEKVDYIAGSFFNTRC